MNQVKYLTIEDKQFESDSSMGDEYAKCDVGVE
jgi:hypothetical protein